ncbi:MULTISPECIES: hypothetical protein [unclassified Streptomyces]|uniref:hypothetical protein n=1 Tax=unclassified Streptomyces TaxID=2593676 RepID=UPI00195501FC|nr:MULTISPECIES: hypothetical protein [unclassified Streptomyces]
MVEPSRVPGHRTVFLGGDDDGAKGETAALLEEFGWAPGEITDLGDPSSARATEALMGLWLRPYGVLGPVDFNISVVTA